MGERPRSTRFSISKNYKINYERGGGEEMQGVRRGEGKEGKTRKDTFNCESEAEHYKK